jgi:predicted deacylase
VPIPHLPFSTRRENQPHARANGIIHYHVKPGDIVQEGDLLATLTDIYGRPLEENSEIRAEHAGWIISLSLGAICYQGQTITNMAIPDAGPMVEQFPVV